MERSELSATRFCGSRVKEGNKLDGCLRLLEVPSASALISADASLSGGVISRSENGNSAGQGPQGKLHCLTTIQAQIRKDRKSPPALKLELPPQGSCRSSTHSWLRYSPDPMIGHIWSTCASGLFVDSKRQPLRTRGRR